MTWFNYLFNIDPRLDHIAAAAFVALVMVLAAIMGGKALKKAKDDVLPESRLTLRTFLELCVDGLNNMVVGVMGQEGRKFTPFIGTMFLFIFFMSMLGVIPGFAPPTANVNTNMGIALIIFLATHYFGFKVHGGGYVKHFMGPVLLLAPLLFLIEMVSHIVRPLSLTVRLYGNVQGEVEVAGIFKNFWSVMGLNFPEIGIPVIFLFLGIFVAFIQAFVFSLLSMIYFSGALSHDH